MPSFSKAPTIRPCVRSDTTGLASIIDATGLFPSRMLEPMIEPFFAGGTEDMWLTADHEGPAGLVYCAPERMTSGTWNALLLAVHPNRQRGGIGTQLMDRLQTTLTKRGAHLLLVETSGLEEFAAQRTFYTRIGYREECRIRDFYRAGEDKVVFSLRLPRDTT